MKACLGQFRNANTIATSAIAPVRRNRQLTVGPDGKERCCGSSLFAGAELFVYCSGGVAESNAASALCASVDKPSGKRSSSRARAR